MRAATRRPAARGRSRAPRPAGARLTAEIIAVRQAELTGAAVDAVHVSTVPTEYQVGYGRAPAFVATEDQAKALEQLLDDTIAEVAGDPPRVTIHARAVEGHPARVRLTAAEGADLLVVGSRGHGGFIGALLGSVSQHCVQHATCPVVVIRGAHQ